MEECNQSLEEIIEEFNLQIDEYAKVKLTPGTPEHTFQQAMIANTKRYRQNTLKDKHDSNLSVLQHLERGSS